MSQAAPMPSCSGLYQGGLIGGWGRRVSEGVLETRGRKIGLLKVESPSLNVSQEFLIV